MTNDDRHDQWLKQKMFLQEVTWHRILGEELHVPETAVLGAEQAQLLGAAIPRSRKSPEFSTSRRWLGTPWSSGKRRSHGMQRNRTDQTTGPIGPQPRKWRSDAAYKDWDLLNSFKVNVSLVCAGQRLKLYTCETWWNMGPVAAGVPSTCSRTWRSTACWNSCISAAPGGIVIELLPQPAIC